MAAARAMLDDEHGTPEEKGVADENCYFLGSTGGHNVVIACLPLGCVGPTSMATVAVHMQRTFKSVRVGLLVGIGSGSPGETDDVRLGDVVVSTPAGGAGGVIQYVRAPAAVAAPDGGGSGSGGQFARVRCLNKPPMVLLTALTSLQARHELMGSDMCDMLSHAAQRYPRLRSKLAAPGTWDGGGNPEDDRLYQAQYLHVQHSGKACDKCDINMLVPRPSKGHAVGPQIHYGVIASADEDIACAITRNQAKEELGVICFEREAAGLMDNFPCLVIRGICDYADTHKSARWQGYAAAMAAAFAKELLGTLHPQDVYNVPTIMEVMNAGTSTLL
jgi:nucleoside phosphorylase